MKRNQKEGVSLKETEKSNYDQVIENWRLKFLEMDQEKLTRKFHLIHDLLQQKYPGTSYHLSTV